MKICSKCKEEKDLSEFHKDNKRKNGLVSRCKNCVTIVSKEYYLKNKEKCKIKNKDYSTNNKVKNKEKCKEYMETFKLKNKGYCKEYMKTRYKTDENFKNLTLIRSKNYLNLKRAMEYYNNGITDKLPSKSHSKQLVLLFDIQDNKCAYCSKCIKDDKHLDHIIPLSKGGSNDVTNLILSCSNCNLRKNNKDLDVWLNECQINYNWFNTMLEERNKVFYG